jgi:hypothetical protein
MNPKKKKEVCKLIEECSKNLKGALSQVYKNQLTRKNSNI